MTLPRARLVTAVLLLLATVAFAAGSLAERHAARAEPAVPAGASTPVDADGGEAAAATSTTDAEAAEAAGSGEVGESGHTEERSGGDGGHGSETFLGISVESTATTVLAVLAGVALAGLVLTVPHRGVAAAVVTGAALFAVLDVHEVVHQVGERRSGLAVAAALVAALHLLAAGSGATLLRARRADGVVAPSGT